MAVCLLDHYRLKTRSGRLRSNKANLNLGDFCQSIMACLGNSTKAETTGSIAQTVLAINYASVSAELAPTEAD